ncbi:MAG: ABC-type transport system substrate-binding protein [Saprospiraceae bacterium]|jgi:ABC-type transport system substrate-binding protein
MKYKLPIFGLCNFPFIKNRVMNINYISKTVFLFVFSALLLVSCRTDPSAVTEVNDIQFKHAGSKTVYVGLPVQLKTLNPISTRSPYPEVVYTNIIQPLMDIDINTYEIFPVLAQSKPIVKELTEGEYAGGISYTYQIKDGAVWDDGSPVTGKDVEFSVKVVFAPKVNSKHYAPYFADFKEVTTDPDNPKIVTVTLDKKYFLGEEASGIIRVMPEYIYDSKKVLRDFSLNNLMDKEKSAELTKNNPQLLTFAEEFNSPRNNRENIVGSGPYKFEEWETGQRVILSKKKDWWGNKYKGQNAFFEANPDTLFYRVVPDQTAMATSLRNEDIDVAFGLNVQDFMTLRESEDLNKLFNFFTPQEFSFYFIYINSQSPLLNDKRVRRALAHLTDVDAIIKNIYNGMATAQPGPISPLTSFFNKDLKQVEYNLEKAKTLLAEAGWADSDENGILDKEIDGKRVEMRLKNVGSETKFSKDLTAYLTSSFQDAGIVLESEILEFNALRQKQNKRDFDISSGALGGAPTPPDYYSVYHTSADNPTGMNRSGFGNAESDKILEEIQSTLTEEGRLPLYRKFQEVLYEEQTKIFLFSPNGRIAISKRLKGEGYGYKPFIHTPSLQFVNAK